MREAYLHGMIREASLRGDILAEPRVRRKKPWEGLLAKLASRGNGKGKDPGARLNLAHFSNSRKATVLCAGV